MYDNLVFKHTISVTGNLHCSFVFTDEESAIIWMYTELPLLEKEYGKLETHLSKLDQLKVGDKCYVAGEGDEEFTITGIINYSPYRYGFQLAEGLPEEVCKCYRIRQ